MSKYSVSYIKGKQGQVGNEKSYSPIDRIRLTAFHTNVAIVVIATLVHVFTGNHIPSMIPLSIATIVVSLFFTVLFVAGKISLLRAYIFNSACLQALLSLRIVLLVILQPEGYVHGIISNEIGSFIIMLYVMLIPRAPFYVSALNIIAVIFVGCYGDGVIAPHFIAFISVMQLILCLLGYYCLKSIEDLQSSNEIYRNNESGILKAFNMSHEELMAYLQLCRHRNGSGGNDVSQFFKLLDAKTEQSIIEAVEARKAEREAEQAELSKRFPKLTETELTICRLVIAGKTQKEIARITGKSESNISTVRGHIRKKLALTPDQDLRQSLLPA